MSTIRERCPLGVEPRTQLIRRSGHVYPLGLGALRAIRRALREVPVVNRPHRGRRPPPVAPYREARCLATLTRVRSGVYCS
jgi:hypothetical protein